MSDNQPLPPRYRQVASIQIVAIRVGLTRILNNIIALMTLHRDVSPTEQTRAKVDRFFDYLTASCETPQLINQRSRWLLHYAKTVDHCLSTILNHPIKQQVLTTFLKNKLLVEEMECLVTSVCLYLSQGQISSDHEKLIFDALNELVELSDRIHPNVYDSSYIDVITSVSDLAEQLEFMTDSRPCIRFDQDVDLIYRLRSMTYKIRYYVDRYEFVSSL